MALSTKLVFDECISRSGYTTFIMNFRVLETIIAHVSGCGIPSRIYERLPRTIPELLFNRKSSPHAEITNLMLIPCTNKIVFSNCLLNDLKTFTYTE